MATELTDVLEELKAVMVAGTELTAEEKAKKTLALVADYLLKNLARQEGKGQVSVLMVIPKSNHLVFAHPPHLSKGNVIPIDRNSIAGRVFLRRKVLVENNVPREPHKDFFERLRDPDGNVRIIQKMVAAPIVPPNDVAIGVVEVSRTGNSPADAGPDFTTEEGEKLRNSCRLFAPYIAQAWSQGPRGQA